MRVEVWHRLRLLDVHERGGGFAVPSSLLWEGFHLAKGMAACTYRAWKGRRKETAVLPVVVERPLQARNLGLVQQVPRPIVLSCLIWRPTSAQGWLLWKASTEINQQTVYVLCANYGHCG